MFEIIIVLLGLVLFGTGMNMTSSGSATVTVDALKQAQEAAPQRTPEPQEPSGKFTTAAEVKPILTATRGNWIAIREYDGQDLLYFTHLGGWRCGLWDVRYGLNGAAPQTLFVFEPCHEDSAQPNAMLMANGELPYVTAPLGSIDSVTVELTYDDGSTDSAMFARKSVLTP